MATILTDNFNSYSDGDLNGQGSWTGDAGFDVQTSVKYEGAKAVQYASSLDRQIIKSGTGQADGTIYVYMRSTGTDAAWCMFLRQTTTPKCAIRLSEGGYIQYQVAGGSFTNIAAYSANTWYCLGIQWQSSDDKCRFTGDGGVNWTGWFAPSGGITTLDNISLDCQTNPSSRTGYFDYIGEYPYSAPTVTTQAATSVTQTGCTGNGNITDVSGNNATIRGFCYKEGTSGDPTTADSEVHDDGDFGTGAYTKAITGLTTLTGYRVRAYATNVVGTSYGTTVQVNTGYWQVDGIGYDTRKKLTVDSSKIDTADLTDFPCLVKLTSTNFDFSHSNYDGYDIRFTQSDGSTLLKYERERHQPSGTTIFEDNFNSYTDGDLNGQGSWVADATYDVEGTTVKEGTKAIYWNGASNDKRAYKTGDTLSEGRVTFYVNPQQTNERSNVILKEGTADICFYSWSGDYGTAGHTYFYAVDGNVDLGAYNVSAWNECEIEWHSSPSHQMRARQNGGTWTDWLAPHSGNDWTTGINRFEIDTNNPAGAFYFDYIAENPYGTETAGNAEYWVKIPTVDYDADTDFYMYYRTTDTADGADIANTWNSNFKGVWHMNDLTTSTIYDSIGASNGTKTSANNPPEIDGKAGKGQDFQGDDTIDCGNNANLQITGALTLEGVYKLDTVTGDNWSINKSVYLGNYAYVLYVLNDEVELFISKSGTTDWMYKDTTSANLEIGVWYHIVGVYDPAGPTMTIYVNGVAKDGTTTGSQTSIYNTAANLTLGSRNARAATFMDGILDEVRISNSVRTAEWIKATYNSNFNTLLTYGAEEEPATGTNMQVNIGDTFKSVSAAQVNIGDTWKTVTSAQVNIGDTWKTIF